MSFFTYKKLALLILLGAVLIGPSVVFAQQTVLQPVPNYRDRDLSDEDLRSCFSPLGFAGVDECGDEITSEVLAIHSSARGLTLQEGDVFRCIEREGYSFPVCTVTHPDGSADSAVEVGLGGLLSSHTDSAGNTTPKESSDDVIERVGDNIVESATNAVAGLAGEIISGVAWIILKISTYLLAIAGTLFNWVMVKAVFQFSTLVGASPGLLTAWSILRDIANMLLLFGFIFVGIAMILDLHSYPAKKALPRLIIFAILMNFSLFVAAAVIDTSNGLSSVLYNQANTDPCANGNALDAGSLTQEECSVNHGLAGYIMQSTGLDSAYTADTVTGLDPTATVGLAMFTLIGAFVLFAAAIMLIIRAVVLAFLMVLAPIGFAALAIPTLEKHGKDWWNRLIHQSFFAPIFLILVFASLKITDSFAETTTRGSLAAAVTHPEASAMGVIMVFALVIGFLIFSLVAAKKFGAMGADFAMKTAGGLTAGTMGWAGRRTVGWAGYNAGQGLSKTKFGQTAIGGAVARRVGSLGTKSFDLRGSGIVGGVTKAAGIDAGKPSKEASKGYKGELEAGIKKRTEYADSLEMSDDEKKRDASLKAEQKDIERRQKRVRKELADANDRAADNERQRLGLEAEINNAQAREVEAAERGDAEAVRRAANEKVSAREAWDKLLKKSQADAAELARIRSGFDAEDKTFENSLKKIKADIEKNNPKARFAKNLEDISFIPLAPGNAARKKAAKKILGDLKKTDAQKLREALGKVNENLGKATSSSGGDHGGGGGGSKAGGAPAAADAHH